MWTSKAAGLVLVALRLKIAIEQEQNMPQASIVDRIWPNLVSSVHPVYLIPRRKYTRPTRQTRLSINFSHPPIATGLMDRSTLDGDHSVG